MILLDDFVNLFNHCGSTLKSIKSTYVVPSEEAFVKYVKNIKLEEFPVLVSIIPSATPFSLNPDNIIEANQFLIFILTKRSQSDYTYDLFLDDMEATQSSMLELKNLLHLIKMDCDEEFHSLLKRLRVETFYQEPEYNLHGCNGWSLSFQVHSEGF